MPDISSGLKDELAQVEKQIENLSPYLAPDEYIKQSKKLNKRKDNLIRLMQVNNSDVRIERDMPSTRTNLTTGSVYGNEPGVTVELVNGKKKKKRTTFKMLSSFSILFIIIAVLVVVSWILSGLGVKANGGDQGEVPIKAMGIVDIFYSTFLGFKGKTEVIVFIMTIGAFITIIINSKALEGFAQGITRKLRGKEVYAIIPLMLFFALCGSVEGMAEESLGFYLILIPVMLMVGFDTWTGVLTVLLGAGIGVYASTINPFVITIGVDAINDGILSINKNATGAQLMSINDGLIWRIICWVIMTAGAIMYVMHYAMKVKKNPQKSVVFDTLEGNKEYFLGEKHEVIKMDWRKKLTLAVFGLAFLIMIVYLVDWDAILGYQDLADAANKGDITKWNPATWGPMLKEGNWVHDNIPYLTALVNGWGKGNSGQYECSAFFLIAAIVVGLINGVKEPKFITQFIHGAADMLSVCLIIAVAGGVTEILQQSNMQALIVSGLGGLNVIPAQARTIVLFLIFFPIGFLIPSSSGFSTALFPMLPKVITLPASAGTIGAIDPVVGPGAVQALSFAVGMINLFAPTSGVVMGAVSVSKITYKDFLKGILPIIGVLWLAAIAMLAAGAGIATVAPQIA